MQTFKQVSWTLGRAAEVGGLIVTFIAVILGLALSGTIVTQSDNARGNVVAATSVNQGGATIFGLLPLMWAVVLLGIMAAAVIKQF
jgi:hypothetical protein